MRNRNQITSERLTELIDAYKDRTGETLDTISKGMGISKSALSKYQSNNADAASSAISKIASFLNVSTDYLLGLTDVARVDTDVQAISNYTGLNEIAIDILHEHQCSGETDYIQATNIFIVGRFRL